jgi:hypothetical protein
MRVARIVLLFAAGAASLSFAAQPQGNPTDIDFSFAGFQAGGRPLPAIAAVIAVRPSGKDDTLLLQSALDHVASLPVGANGFRGAVLLRPGRFHVSGQVRLHASGVVLRGSGNAPNGTVIVAEGIGRRTLIQVGGDSEPAVGEPIHINDAKVNAGARRITLASVAGLQVGSRVVVRRASTAAWIKSHAMSGLPGNFADARIDWKPGSHDLVWDRTITSIDVGARQVDLDAPITFELAPSAGPGSLELVHGNASLQNIGVESLRLESAFDPANLKDEEHSWIAITLDHVEDAWVRNITARHFVSSAVRAGHRARRVTIQDCSSEAPISEQGGYRRQSFLVYGQQVLVLRCRSEAGMNDFATGLLAAGPNVFIDCTASGSLEASGAFEGLAAGVLYENVHVPDSRIQLLLDQSRAQAAGWTAVNSVIWNSTAKSLDAVGPYDGYNFVIDSPQPLYREQLRVRGLSMPVDALLARPDVRVRDFHAIEKLPARAPPQHPFTIVNGHFVIDGKVVYGGSHNEAWWHGNTSPEVSGALTGWSVSRFMPGETAPGLTEDIDALVSRVKNSGDVFYQSIPGLWYDHRRDEHTITCQQNGDVWAPFFEMPWARSGKGIAWDGLSRFDLSRYNPWYFQREREFVRIASEQGLIVYYNLYNTHDVLEIGPHWIDYPWRPANNINDTGLPEPPPFEARAAVSMDAVKPPVTRLNVGNQFYSTDYPPLRKLHNDYILHVLDQLGELPNVIFTLAYQYAGPLAFQQFFLDTVREWEKAHGRKVKIALITSKQSTDAILADPVRSRQIDVVDMRYWYYLNDGTLFAPDAGQNRAFRDLINSRFGGNYTNTGPSTKQDLVYKQIREYRDRYPSLALVPMENGAGPIPILMGGAASESSLQAIPDNPDPALSTDAMLNSFVRRYLADDLMKMTPVDGWVENPAENWVLAGNATDATLIYSRGAGNIVLTRPLRHTQCQAVWLNPATGQTIDALHIACAPQIPISRPDKEAWLLLLRPTSTP